MKLAADEEIREAQAALAHWKETLLERGYEGLRPAYLGKPVEEFFDYKGVRYGAVTEAAWDGKSGGDLRVFMELSVATDEAPFVFLEEDMIVAPDGSLVGE